MFPDVKKMGSITFVNNQKMKKPASRYKNSRTSRNSNVSFKFDKNSDNSSQGSKTLIGQQKIIQQFSEIRQNEKVGNSLHEITFGVKDAQMRQSNYSISQSGRHSQDGGDEVVMHKAFNGSSTPDIHEAAAQIKTTLFKYNSRNNSKEVPKTS